MATVDFTTTITVDKTPIQVFDAINDVRGWWSEEIEGRTDKLNSEFKYHYKDIHRSKMKIIEFVPGKKVVWLVLDNDFKFTKDKNEWKGNKIIFDITTENNKTQLQFTQLGLVPAYECYDICREAWSNYINNSLYSLIITGKGQPNAKESEFDEKLLKKHNKLINIKEQNYHTSITVDATAHQVFENINNVTKWWTENFEGRSHKLNDEFSVSFGDVHYSRQKVIEVIPDKKVVWLVTDSKLSFIQDKKEWTNTKIVFDIIPNGTQTAIHFTHIGLVLELECFDKCSDAWDRYIQGSLKNLVNTGKGQPEKKESKPKGKSKN